MKQQRVNDAELAEGLSGLADDEVSLDDLGHWVNVLARDEPARRRLARYRLIGSFLHDNGVFNVDASEVADQVSKALQDEPAILAPQRRKRSFSIPRLALGGALAAGVAALAVGLAPRMAGVNQPQESLGVAPNFAFAPRLSVPADGITMVGLGPGVSPSQSSAIQSGQRWKVLSPVMQHKIARYLLEHNELAGHIAAQRPSSHLSYISTHDAQP